MTGYCSTTEFFDFLKKIEEEWSKDCLELKYLDYNPSIYGLKKNLDVLINYGLISFDTINSKKEIVCRRGKHRSLEDIYKIIKSYMVNVTLVDVIYNLLELLFEEKIKSGVCGGIQKRTFAPLINERAYGDFFTDGKTLLKDLEFLERSKKVFNFTLENIYNNAIKNYGINYRFGSVSEENYTGKLNLFNFYFYIYVPNKNQK